MIARILAALATLAAATAMLTGPAHADVVICEKWGSTTIQGGRYVVQNNNWGDDTTQCIDVTDTGFTVTQAVHDKPQNGAPGSYPSVFAGCHYAVCSTGSGLPMQASDARFAGVRTNVTFRYPSSGVYDAAYDLWFDPTPRTDGQNTGAELMIWLHRTGSVQPVGSRVATVNLAGGTWDVWFGNIGWNVVSYVRTAPATTIDFAVDTFYGDAVSRGYAQRSWYLTSVQAGFEPWVGGVGLAVDTFGYSTGGVPGDTTPPSAPGGLAASGVTASGVGLSWSASSDNVGVVGYDVLRAGASGAFAVVGSSGSTSFGDAGLSANTTYRYQVRARDAAGNVSAVSNTVTVTTTGGGGGGGCTAVYTQTGSWGGGFQGQVIVTNAGATATTGWRVTLTFGGGQTVTQVWNGRTSQTASPYTVTSETYNGALAPGASTTFGFLGTWTGTNPAPAVSCARTP
ncbi:GH12 family glycosyl hydrolase domain-containing protein [Nonomuraea cavernae]|uniref:Glycosyl hydrolase family 5 n=1 Tax=Nonomuraea cavernae TaxID=2045107 RepID=A0A917Z690_9ACTN|nr:cellulose binding domain-containing protein [Nonomuraea cavernae]MCA2189302.1 cellulose binding domain-containing protein [Nonomuraea cavernae]GGO76435.1 hypothetical protein GCM10012289_53760 [Nonomuraea cavernae]